MTMAYRHVTVEGLRIAYREAGTPGDPALVLLHGFPSSSHMFRDLMPRLANTFHVIAPDYPGFGYSDAPDSAAFSYTFDRVAEIMRGCITQLGIQRFALYAHDFGGPVGFRIAAQAPERIAGLVIQNANAYLEGLSPAAAAIQPFWEGRSPETEQPVRNLLSAEGIQAQYVTGTPDPERLSPDAWTLDHALVSRPGRLEIQIDLLHDYPSNLARYSQWQQYFRDHQPPTLIVWGQGDPFFLPEGARAYLRDLPAAQLHFLDAGHFALESRAEEIAALAVGAREAMLF